MNFCCGDCWARYNDTIFSIDRHGWVDDSERECFRKTDWFPISRHYEKHGGTESMTPTFAIRIEVTAGTVEHKTTREYTKSWEVSIEEWDSADREKFVLRATNTAFGYAKSLRREGATWVNVQWQCTR